jgi:hypothetical protein
MSDPAYCESPPPTRLPGPIFPEPEAAVAATATLYKADKLPVDFDLWKGPMDENELAPEAGATNYTSQRRGYSGVEWRYYQQW